MIAFIISIYSAFIHMVWSQITHGHAEYCDWIECMSLRTFLQTSNCITIIPSGSVGSITSECCY